MRLKRLLITSAAVAVATAVWLPCVHVLFATDADARAEPISKALATAWSVGAADDGIAPMRAVNPEWDFMARTFFILAQANMALGDPGRKTGALAIIDRLLDDTLKLEAENGMTYFLMDYHSRKPWADQPPRSIFVDGEIALCIGARRLVEDNPERKLQFEDRVRVLDERLQRGAVLNGESYPDECWLFCNTIALAAMKMSDVLDGSDHSAFFANWLDMARGRLIDEDTGLLIATFTLAGEPHPAGPGPEGTTTWLATHMLQLIDPGFADDQYRRAREHLGDTLLGFGYSREWPVGAGSLASLDVDSGPVIPIFGASASASGLALVGAAAFDDDAFSRQLISAMNFGAFYGKATPDGGLFHAAGVIGNAVALYAMVEGPLWQRIELLSSETP